MAMGEDGGAGNDTEPRVPQGPKTIASASTLVVVEANMHWPLPGEEAPDAGSDAWDADQVFAIAIRGVVDAMLPAVVATSVHILSDGNVGFPRDLEPVAPPIDRNGAYLLQRKTKHKRSASLMNRLGKNSIYNVSRAVSRASSRSQSRYGPGPPSLSNTSVSLSGSLLAMKMAKLALKPPAQRPSGPFPQDQERGDNGGGVGDSYAGLSSRYSLASGTARSSRTSRMPVDYQELRRREEITRDIASREDRERLTARIQRMSQYQLKLRSMDDPTVSLEREERQAAAKARGGLLSRSQSRGVASTSIMAAAADATGISSRSSETTYRPEDYENLASEVVVLDPRGELVVGENCRVVTKKARADLHSDMFQQSNIRPRIRLPEPEAAEETTAGSGNSTTTSELPIDAAPRSPATRGSPAPRVPSRHSPERKFVTTQHPAFEGLQGTFQSYPKIELDPKKTPLTKGVAIKSPELAPLPLASVTSPLKDVLPPSTKAKVKKTTHFVNRIEDDSTNDGVERQLQTMLASKGSPQFKSPLTVSTATGTRPLDPKTSARPTTRGQPASRDASDANLPKHTQNHPSAVQYPTTRLRTPAYGNRLGRLAALGMEALDPIDDDEQSHITSKATMTTLHTSGLPKVPYMREFPTAPTGHIQVLSSKVAATLMAPSPAPGFPFASLPTMIRGKR